MNDAERKTLLGMLYPLLLKRDWKRTLTGDMPAVFVMVEGKSETFPYSFPDDGPRFLSGVIMPDPTLNTTGHVWYLAEPTYDDAFANLPPDLRRAWGELLDLPKPRRLFYRIRDGEGALLNRNPDVPQPCIDAGLELLGAVRVQAFGKDEAGLFVRMAAG